MSYLKGLKKGMHLFGKSISICVNTALLFAVYIVGAGITSIIAKMSGKRFLDKRLSKDEDTYWSDIDLKKKPIDEYYRQF